jgi:hypothetical protein
LQKKEDIIANLQFEVNQLKRMLFKSRGERFVPYVGKEETSWS